MEEGRSGRRLGRTSRPGIRDRSKDIRSRDSRRTIPYGLQRVQSYRGFPNNE